MTEASKLEKTEAMWNDKGVLEIVDATKGLSAKNNHNKFPLHEIDWNEGQEGDLLNGKKLKLMGFYEEFDHYFIKWYHYCKN